MRNVKLILLGISTLVFLNPISVFAQSRPYEGPDDAAGDIAAEREGYMNGNRILLYFQNNTELAFWSSATANSSQWSRWPNNYQGTRMLDGLALLIGARVYIQNDTIPVEDPDSYTGSAPLDTLYYLQTSYREEMDTNPTGNIEWGLYPVFGYFNELSDYPAMSNKESSWPAVGWPSPTGPKWPGEWNGRFGRGVKYADLETYFVANDAQDQEYLGPEDRVKYYPRPGEFIGDRDPSVTIQKGAPWGGLGLRVEVRGFQWNNPQARDAIFWEYTIANVSDYDLPEVAFGYWVDNGIGGDAADDEWGYFDTQLDMSYSWDNNALGDAGLTPGIMGFAYLESPGMSFDGIDNDEDGLVDEQRDNDVGGLIGPTDGINNLQKFLEFYNLQESDLKEHYAGDEDQDWQDGRDLNDDGIYQITEYPGDDVGLDGIGPAELNYTGPDQGEGNHMPDFVEGVGCEPNYNFTDVSESDMVGLTSFRLFPIQSHASDHWWFRGDRSMWELVGQDSLIEFSGSIANLVEVFASGPFPLYKGLTERISMSELHAFDPLAGLQSDNHHAPALFQQKRIVQVIYERDYRFAQPPAMPTLTATPGDDKVILTWDNFSDQMTRDPFMGNVNDFQGYKLFRATDKKMSDPEVITDGYGTPTLKKPIFQCDIIDGTSGFADYGMINGVGYYLGSDNGLTHYFVDNTVQNGRTYYYAIVGYDSGAASIGPGISPSQNRIIIDVNESEEVVSIGPNVQIVTPHQPAAGFVEDEVEAVENQHVVGTGTVAAEILAEGSLKKNNIYTVKFDVDTLQSYSDYGHGLEYTNTGFRVYDATAGNELVYQENPDNFAFQNIVYNDTSDTWHIKEGTSIYTDVFDGLRLEMTLPVEKATYNFQESGWITGAKAVRVMPSVGESRYFPWDYVIEFTADEAVYTGKTTNVIGVRDAQGNRIPRSELLGGEDFSFRVINTSFTDSTGGYPLMDLLVRDMNENGEYDLPEDRVLVGAHSSSSGRWGGTILVLGFENTSLTGMPESGDKYFATFERPFIESDSLMFNVVSNDSLDEAGLKESMKQIKVVPNPYVATNAMESAVANSALNQRRRLLFTHIPAQCDIKIFTVSGVLVDEIHVNNVAENGTAHWDMLTKEGLEIAGGMYLYHIKSTATGEEKTGKFAVIK
ncbi:MAG: hypothetical protein K9N46_14840 [Candidatus Marinimicrobia bacterium]|nr:hypothetical protein [Candidatus Neomarinimicrobiota bacterium]MCF7829557.1 hypothetical protein [Candidatus Neomarinimicrobiota bacterium]MCF7882007.1 hypothetical protein [Candidatus Neomarinimicrobiota bacterium]